MSAHGPDERLSAFYDGELSAVERAEVERLLTERPNLRAELSAITDLSQRLSDLADDFPEADLRPRVLQRIAAVRPAVATSAPQMMRRRWMPLLLTVSSLSLLLAAVWPLLPHSNQTQRLAKTDSAPAWHASLDGVVSAPTATTVTLAGSVDSPSDHPLAIAAKSTSMDSAEASGGTAIAIEKSSGQEAEMSRFLTDLVQSRAQNGRELNPGEVISRVIDGNESSLIAEYTVIDVKRSAHDVGIVLQQNGIVPLDTSFAASDKVELSGPDRATDAKPPSSVMVFVVEAESEPLNSALFRCETLQQVVTSNVESLNAYCAVDSTVASGEASSPSHFDAPAPANTPASSSVDMQRKSGDPQAVVMDDVPSKNKPAARNALPAEPLEAPSTASDQVVLELADRKRETSKETQLVFGNSLLVPNGEELVAELQQRQSQLSQSSNRLNSAKQTAFPKEEPFSSATQRATPIADSLQQKAYNSPSVAGQSINGLQYNSGFNTNGLNGYRSRQRAILVLRPQSPPAPAPPPGPAPADPQGG